MDIRILGAHNCESQSTRLVSLLIDESLVLDAGGITSTLSMVDQQKTKTILLTHHHYDHIRDIPMIAMNFYLAENRLNIGTTPSVYEVLTDGLLNGQLYPDFFERPAERPTLTYIPLEPYSKQQIGSYTIKAVPVNHSVPSVGFEVTSTDGGVLFYTGDTGPGLADCWRQISPQLLIIEVTASNEYREFGIESGHLTPELLKQDLLSFRDVRRYLPRIVTVHMNPGLEDDIRHEIADVADELGCDISLGYEGMYISV